MDDGESHSKYTRTSHGGHPTGVRLPASLVLVAPDAASGDQPHIIHFHWEINKRRQVEMGPEDKPVELVRNLKLKDAEARGTVTAVTSLTT